MNKKDAERVKRNESVSPVNIKICTKELDNVN
nr:MAG TPA: hypothetical protein [Caudoviricetes sp.]